MTSYSTVSHELFSEKLPYTAHDTKLFADFNGNDYYMQKCFAAMQNIECEYVEKIVANLKENNIQGDFVEFGIFQGGWINRLFDMTEQLAMAERKIWGFDSFCGLSAPGSFDSSFWKQGMYACDVETVSKNVKLAERPRIKLVQGFFVDSLQNSEAQQLGKVAYARIDCDLYEPARQALDFLTQRLVPGAVLVFDDWSQSYEYGEGKAFYEWTRQYQDLAFRYIFMGPWDHLYLQRL